MSAEHAILLTSASGDAATGFLWRGSNGVRLVTVAHTFGTHPASTEWRRWSRSVVLHVAGRTVTEPLFDGAQPLFAYVAILPAGMMHDVISLPLSRRLQDAFDDLGWPAVADCGVGGLDAGAPLTAYGFQRIPGQPDTQRALMRRQGMVLSREHDVYLRTTVPSQPGNSGAPVFAQDGSLAGILIGNGDNAESLVIDAEVIHYLGQQATP